ncbi:MAG: DNA polymerase III subunit delta [Bacilli bacterium]|nr:DNA polymerase III subunit delta [Bacilli bacterium]
MIYVIYSESQKGSLRREARKITKEALNEVNEFNYASFDAKETSLREIVNACLEVPMLENKKVVVVSDAYFLTGGKGKDKINTEKDYQILEKYINTPANETDLILLVESDKLDSRGKLTKLLSDKAKLIPIAPMKLFDWEKFVSQICEKKNINIDYLAKKELAVRTLNDRERLSNELIKLSLYTNQITLNDILTLVSKPLEDSAYELTNALLRGDIASALITYNDLTKSKKIDPVTLFIMLANQFRFIYQVNYLHDQGKRITEIMELLSAKEFRVKMAYQNGKAFKNSLPKILDDLYEIDNKIKSSQIDNSLAAELFIVNFKNNYF